MCLTLASSPWHRPLRSAAALLFALVVLAACGSSKVATPSAATQATPPQPTAPTMATPMPAVNHIKVALLLPLSGDQAALGASLLQASQLALFEAPDSNVEILVRDTGDSAVGAAQAAQDAIGQGAQLVLGPIFGNAVKEVTPVAQTAGINVVSFSTDRSVAQPGVYVMGILPSLQVQRVVGYASRQGLHRIAALLPQSPYGQTVKEALDSAAHGAKAQVVRVDFYDPRTLDASTAVGQTGQYISSGGAVDALLVPETAERLHGITGQFGSFGIDPTRVRLLGSTLWADDPALGSDPTLVGGWYAAPDPGPWGDFRNRFRAAYSSDPPRLATIAYDATLLAILLAGGPHGPDFSTTALTDPAGFSGVDGIFRFNGNGSVERGLAIMEIHDGFVDVREPAPTSFDQVIY
ncbi:MAG TPA: penicillin-binding protein activator [Candidatus Angelobacter sp.]|nr:penicillin-binding protein activator [Candidatus Angelobacter sp.]